MRKSSHKIKIKRIQKKKNKIKQKKYIYIICYTCLFLQYSHIISQNIFYKQSASYLLYIITIIVANFITYLYKNMLHLLFVLVIYTYY